jgi:hypothetical protein
LLGKIGVAGIERDMLVYTTIMRGGGESVLPLYNNLKINI